MLADVDLTQQEIQRLLLERDVERFLYREAELLDDRRYEEWLDLWTDDAHYFMPIRRNIKFGQWDAENTSELTDISWFDEGKQTLTSRVVQLNTGIHWSEEPPSRTCHMVSTVRIDEIRGDEVVVHSRFLIYRNRLADEQNFFVGKREDVLRRVEGQWKIASRKVILDQSVLLSKNVTFFF